LNNDADQQYRLVLGDPVMPLALISVDEKSNLGGAKEKKHPLLNSASAQSIEVDQLKVRLRYQSFLIELYCFNLKEKETWIELLNDATRLAQDQATKRNMMNSLPFSLAEIPYQIKFKIEAPMLPATSGNNNQNVNDIQNALNFNCAASIINEKLETKSILFGTNVGLIGLDYGKPINPRWKNKRYEGAFDWIRNQSHFYSI